MLSSDSQDRLVVLAIGLLVILGPVVILIVTFGFLAFTDDLVLGGISTLEFLELYILELILFAGITYGIYRLMLWSVEHRLGGSVDVLDGHGSETTADDESNLGEESE